MRRQLAYAVPLVSLLLLAGGCAKPAQSSGNNPPPIAGPATVVSTPPGNSVGTVYATQQGTNGTQNVSCDAIDTELLISPEGGQIRWTAGGYGTTSDSFPFVADPLPSVVVDPSSGVLDPGQSQILHISGTFDGAPGDSFYVEVNAGNSGSTLQLSCT
ncbi:MAG TPA: hypothetical protein VGS06_26210 [Streptosporangiaceae bacterium]|nr:hypothetical protein [Streptosporangiaceae bacterium]